MAPGAGGWGATPKSRKPRLDAQIRNQATKQRGLREPHLTRRKHWVGPESGCQQGKPERPAGEGTRPPQASLKCEGRDAYSHIAVEGLALSKKSKRYKGVREYKYTCSPSAGCNSASWGCLFDVGLFSNDPSPSL